MGIRIGLFLVGTLCSAFCSAIHISSGGHLINYSLGTSSSTGEKNFKSSQVRRTINIPDESSSRASYGREIIEISDPTTDSTLHLPHYPAVDCTNGRECDAISSDTTPMPTFRPYSQEELNGFLKKYVQSSGQMPNSDQASNKLANLYMDETVNVLENDKDTGKSQEKSKSWQLMQSQNHKKPYDDQAGWVTLEPVPWSASQIQKWEPNKRPPEIPQWNEDPPQTTWNRPAASKPWINKNTYEYKPSSRPWPDKYNSKPAGWNSDNWGAGSEIITDNSPSQFPHDQARPNWYERPHTEVIYQGSQDQVHPQSHPLDGDGRWVLLSSTKGYSVPHRSRAHQRSLFVTANTPSPNGAPSVKSHRSIRLTVLPPLNGTMKTTTIHNGLVEVEQTSQTVDEAHREHVAKMLKLESLNSSSIAHLHSIPPPKPQPVAPKRTGTAIRVYPVNPVNQARSNAMLAAVGAGMIPATVAMMLPMVLGRRRRSVPEFKPLPDYQIHVPPIHQHARQ